MSGSCPSLAPAALAAPATFRLLIFDWDGTLMDSVASIVACMDATTASLGLPPLPEERVRDTVGLGLGDTLERLFPGGDNDLHGRVLDGYRRLWLGDYRNRCSLYPGAVEALDRLAEAGYLLAVATGKSRAGLDRDLALTGLAGRFAATRTVSEAPSKPEPTMLWEILAELAVSPVEALMIGDTTFDLEMARRAGVAAVGVASGAHRRESLAALQPLVCLETVAEVPGWLAGRAPARRP